MNKKWIIFGVIILVLVSFFSFFIINNNNNGSKQIKKIDPNIGYNDGLPELEGSYFENELMRVDFPENWKGKKLGSNSFIIGPNRVPSGTNILETSLRIESTKTREDFWQTPFSLESFKKSTNDQLDNFIENLNFDEESEDPFKGMKGFTLVYTGEYQGTKMKWLQFVATDSKTRMYEFGFSVEESKYDEYIGDIQSIIESLEVK